MRYLYSVATGKINLLSKRSKQAAEFMKNQQGFVSVYPDRAGILWLYDSLNNAKGARNLASLEGIHIGENICKFEVKDKDTIQFVEGCK